MQSFNHGTIGDVNTNPFKPLWDETVAMFRNNFERQKAKNNGRMFVKHTKTLAHKKKREDAARARNKAGKKARRKHR